MGRHKLRTMNIIAFYRWQFECTEIPWRDPEAHCRAIHLPPSPHISAWQCTAPCQKDLYTIPGSWKCPSSSMACILTRHVRKSRTDYGKRKVLHRAVTTRNSIPHQVNHASSKIRLTKQIKKHFIEQLGLWSNTNIGTDECTHTQ